MEAGQLQAPSITLSHRHVFGLKADVKNNIHFAEENQVIYPAGHNTILYYTDHKTQRFFPGNEGTDGICCLAVSPSKRYLAISERCSDHAIVTIFDLVTTKKRKTLSFVECDAREFVCVAFSSENKFLVTQGGPSPSGKHDWTLIYWAWDKARPMAAQKVSNQQNAPVHECSFNPADSSTVVVVGDGIFKFFRLQDGAFKQLPNQLAKLREHQNYTCHAWLNDDRLVVGCENGDLLLFDNGGEFKTVLPCSPGDPRSLITLLAFSKGFVAGGDDAYIRVFEKSDDPKEVFRKAKEMRVDRLAPQSVCVRSLAVSPSEEHLAVSTSTAQLYQLSLLSSDLLKTDEAPQSEFVLTSFHVGPIQGMDVCARKPLVVTCGSDKSVRVWNYLEKSCELCKTFNEEAYSVAFHPSGFHLIVGFSDKLRLMNLLMEDMRTFKDVPIKACRECRFSNGGQYFAAVNSNTIQVYKTYTCEMVANLRGHNNKVRSLCWTADDSTLVSAGMDGAVYEYNIVQEGRRVSDWVHKGVNFSCVLVYTDPSTGGNTMYVVGSDRMLKEVYNSTLQNYLEAGTTLGQIVLSNSAKTLFASVAEADGSPGPIRCYKFPLDGDYIEYQCHSAAATRVRITYDDQYLFSCSEDGCLFIFDIRKKDRVVSKRDKENVLPFADEILVTRTFLDEKQAQLLELERQVDELSNQIDFQLRHRDSYHKEKMAELEDKYGQEIEQERTKYELLREEKNDMEMEYEENIKNLEELHAKQTQDLEASFQHKMMIEVGRYQKLAAERDAEHQHWEKQHRELIEQHNRQVAEMRKRFVEQELEDASQRHRITEEKLLAERVHLETLRQLEQDADREIEELKDQYEEKLAQEKDDKVRLRGQAGIHRKHHEDLKRQMQKKEEELRQHQDEARKRQERIDALIKERDHNLKEIKERDRTIGDKEQKIYDLKKQNQELEKFKFVLDYKIKELKAQIDPKNDDIAEMKKQIQAMDADLEDYHRRNKQLQLDISSLLQRQRGLQEEIVSRRKRLTDSQTIIKRFKNDLHECVQFIQEPRQLRDSVTQLFRKYVPHGIRKQELDTDIAREYNRQREYLEKSVESLKRKLMKDSEVHRQDNMRIMQENVSLIREINDLRKEISFLMHERQQQRLNVSKGKGGKQGQQSSQAASAAAAAADASSGQRIAEYQREIEDNKGEIARIRRQIAEQERKNDSSGMPLGLSGDDVDSDVGEGFQPGGGEDGSPGGGGEDESP